jgi:hypothetical protein
VKQFQFSELSTSDALHLFAFHFFAFHLFAHLFAFTHSREDQTSNISTSETLTVPLPFRTIQNSRKL